MDDSKPRRACIAEEEEKSSKEAESRARWSYQQIYRDFYKKSSAKGRIGENL